MKRFLFLLLFISSVAFGQSGALLTTLLADGGGASPTVADFYLDNVTVSDGTANIFIREPANVASPPTGGWPVVLWYGGDGTDNNNTTTVTGQSLSTGDNLTYTFASSVPANRILGKSIVIKVDGTPTGYGQFGGDITGTGISSGSFGDAVSSSNATCTVTFSSSQAGSSITLDYVYSAMLYEGLPFTVNQGDDLDERCIFVAVQNVSDNLDYELDYFDNVVEHIYNLYTINPKRISVTGLSRGGVFCIETSGTAGSNNSVLKTRYQFWIKTSGTGLGAIVTTDPLDANYTESGLASIATAAPAYGAGFTYANYTRIGIAIVHGTSDGTISNVSYSIAAVGNTFGLIERPQILNLWNVGHNGTCWHTNYAYREFATGGVSATAGWDWVDFVLKYSYDDVEAATLHVEQAEKRRYNTEKDIIDWRKANRRVELLSASAEKTALQSRLSTLYSTIANGGTYYLVNFHNFGNSAASPPFNNMTTMNGSQTLSNINDEEGNASVIDLTLTNSHASAGGARLTWSNRTAYLGGLDEYADNSGFKVISSASTFAWGSLPTGTYNMRIYTNENTGNWTTEAQLSTTVNGVTKTKFSPDTLTGWIEYTGLSETQIASWTAIRGAARDVGISFIELYKQP